MRVFIFLFVFAGVLFSNATSDLVISRADRRIDLSSHIVRSVSTLKVENAGPEPVSEVLFALPDYQANNLANIMALYTEGSGKGASVSLSISSVHPEAMPPEPSYYSISLPNALPKGGSLTLNILTIFTHCLKPLPEEITQAEDQLVIYEDSAYLLSPYKVKVQTIAIRLPSGRVESYTKYQNTKLVDSELRYGSFENSPPFSHSPLFVHFENNNPFAVVEQLVREIEISHWGNVQVTEHYSLIHGGARNKGGFSRIDYQARPNLRGASSFRHLIARLPPRAHCIYYRDEIGNISTSHLWSDSKRTQLEIEPRFPMFGGWRTSFTVGYGLPLKDFLFEAEGKRFLNITFGCPMLEVVIDNLIVKVVLPEGSGEVYASVPFHTKQWQGVKYSNLDISGRPVVVIEKDNIVPEHNLYFQVSYKFNKLQLLREPLMLIFGFFFLFSACIMFMHTDLTISKSSASYVAKAQWDEVRAVVQQIGNVFTECLAVHDKLEASLRDLSRTGNVQTCKAVRKSADSQLKDLAKTVKTLLVTLQSFPQASRILPKVEELISKEKELQEKLMLKHSIVVESFERKQGARETESRVASVDQKLVTLRQEVDDLLEFIDEL